MSKKRTKKMGKAKSKTSTSPKRVVHLQELFHDEEFGAALLREARNEMAHGPRSMTERRKVGIARPAREKRILRVLDGDQDTVTLVDFMGQNFDFMPRDGHVLRLLLDAPKHVLSISALRLHFKGLGQVANIDDFFRDPRKYGKHGNKGYHPAYRRSGDHNPMRWIARESSRFKLLIDNEPPRVPTQEN